MAQVNGGVAGCVVANLMFSEPAIDWSSKSRAGGGLWLAEVVAILGLLLVIFGAARSGRANAAPFAVGAYIGAAYFFTASTSFANPAVTVARAFSDTFAGIGPASAPAFVAFQLVGTAVAVVALRLLYPTTPADDAAEDVAEDLVDEVVVPHRRPARACRHGGAPGVFGSSADPGPPGLAQARGAIVTHVPQVLFVCVHNAGRSQMAASLLDHLAAGRVHVRSAGSAPADEINPAVVAAMDELGLDLSREIPKPLTDEAVGAADVVVTMGCGDACPFYPGKRYLDWQLDDRAGKSVDEVRQIRDDIDGRVRQLLEELIAP